MAAPSAPHRLAGEVARGARRPGAARTLLLDVDGTLAPIAPTPEQAAVPGPTLGAIAELVAGGWTVALVSGRPAAQVRTMVPVAGTLAFGSHGLEVPDIPADAVSPATDGAILERLDTLERAAAELAGPFAGVRIERKPAGLAFHDRALAGPEYSRWRSRLEAWLERQDLEGLQTLEGKRIVEIRPAGIDKGTVVRRLAGRLRREGGDRSFVAVGDDRTDEDMFRVVLALGGLAVRVGRDGAPTLAERHLGSPSDVGSFLEILARLAA